jgi:hypothetical protein
MLIKNLRDYKDASIIFLSIILIIFMFSQIYFYIYRIDNTSFIGIDNSSSLSLFTDFFYFSTITFTTLGYGDITPVTVLSKFIVIIESLVLSVFISIIALNFITKKK